MPETEKVQKNMPETERKTLKATQFLWSGGDLYTHPFAEIIMTSIK